MNFNDIIEKIVEQFKPISIFLYGSRAREDFAEDSDYEIGVIFERERYFGRSELRKIIPDTQYSIFPFKLDELIEFKIDTPFPKNIYLRSMIDGGARTIYGKNIIETIEKPKIKIIDLILDLRTNIGKAMSAVLVSKENNIELANELFYKSCLYATRTLIILKSGKLLSSYDEIAKEFLNIEVTDEYRNLVQVAHDLRKKKIEIIDIGYYFKNISYMNQFIEPMLLDKDINEILID